MKSSLKVIVAAIALAAAGSASSAPFISAESGIGALPATVSRVAVRSADSLSLQIGDQRYTLVADKVFPALDGQHWEGHLRDEPGRKAAFIATADGVTGILDLPGRPLRLGLVNRGQWLLDTPAAEVRDELVSLPQLFVARPPEALRPDAPGAAARPAEGAYPVALNFADLATVEPGQNVQLPVPGNPIKLTYDATSVSPEGTSTWNGHLADYGPDYRAFITYSPDGSVTGSIMGPKGEFLINGQAGQTWLIDTAAAKLLPNPHALDGDALAPPVKAPAAGGMAMGGTAAGTVATTATSVTVAAAGTTAGTVVDLLVLYTPGLVARYGSDAGALNRIDYFISLANKAYADSGVPITVRRVAVQAIAIADTSSNTTTLSSLQANSGAFAAVGSLRNQYGADAVLLVRPFYASAQGMNCGVGYIGGYGGSAMSAYAGSAYAVVSEGTDMTNSGYYCVDYTFTHELGHNMGLMHDRPTVAAQGGGTGALPYAFGYGKTTGSPFGTIMSYDFPVLGKFSNPLDSSCNGGPCGVAETDTANSADNAKALGITKDAFSAYRPTVVGGQVSIAGIVTLDGKVAGNVPVLANGTACATTASTGTYACTFASGWTGTVSVTAPVNASCTPLSQAYTSLQASTSLNFACVSKLVSIVLSGIVTIDGKAASGIAMNASASAAAIAAGSPASTSCGASSSTGAFACTVRSGWSGSLLASGGNASFAALAVPATTVSLTTLRISGTSLPAKTTLTGTVRVNGSPVSGASIYPTYYSSSGGPISCTGSNASGVFSCTLYTHSNLTLAAAYPNATFSPAAVSLSNVAANPTVNFSGTIPTYTLSGTVKVNGVGRAGLPVTAGGKACATTASGGSFSCRETKGWSGTVTVGGVGATVTAGSLSQVVAPMTGNVALAFNLSTKTALSGTVKVLGQFAPASR